MLVWDINPATGTLFSNWLALDTDLGTCAVSFTRLLLATAIISVSLGAISAGLVVSDLIDVFSYKRSFAVYRKLFLVGAVLTGLLLLPLFFKDAGWYTGGRYGMSRIDLANACIASHYTTFYRLYWQVIVVVILGWASLMVLTSLRRAIIDGRDPNQLSDDPRVREIQLRALKWSERRQAVGRIVFKVAATGLAAAFFLMGAWSMKPAVVRFVHTLTWERQKVSVVETGMQCVLEVKVRRGWTERSRADCSMIPSIPVPDNGAWRITKIPTAKLAYRAPNGGQYSFDVVGDFYVNFPTSVGAEIEVLRNPASPEGIDKIFDGGDIERMFYKLLMIIAGAVAFYYLWVRKPQNLRAI